MRYGILLLVLCSFGASAQHIPDGWVLFTKNTEGRRSELFEVHTDGSGLKQVTHSGKEILMGKVCNGSVAWIQNDSSKVLLMVRNGNGPAKAIVTDHVCNPHWRNDGRLIAYESDSDAKLNIWTCDPNGNNKHQLIRNAWHPCWNADGSSMIFTRDYEIYCKDLTTGKERQLTHVGKRSELAKWPAWSPGGGKVAYVVFKGGAAKVNTGIVILDLHTGKEQEIDGCSMPSWTNNDGYLLCSYRTGTAQEIAIVDVGTGKVTPITHSGGFSDFPAWMSGEL